MIEPWPLISSEAVADFGLLRVFRDRAVSPRTGAELDFQVVRMPDWVLVVPIDAHGRIAMVRQFRHGSRRAGLELPGGLAAAGPETPLETAARELLEETGYGGGSWWSLGAFWPQPAFLANRLWLYAASDVAPRAAASPDPGEDIEVELVAGTDVAPFIRDGHIHSAPTVLALALAGAAGLIASPLR